MQRIWKLSGWVAISIVMFSPILWVTKDDPARVVPAVAVAVLTGLLAASRWARTRTPRPASVLAVNAALLAWNGHTSVAILWLALAVIWVENMPTIRRPKSPAQVP